MSQNIDHNRPNLGLKRRKLLKHIAGAGAGMALSNGIAGSAIAAQAGRRDYPAGVPWVSMRGNRQNTGVSPLVRLHFTPASRAPILAAADTNRDGLSLINATPVIGPGDVVYVGSSNNHFYSFDPPSQTLTGVTLGNIVNSAGCFVSPELLYFPCGDFSLYDCPAGNVAAATPNQMTTDGGSPSTIHWFEGNVVANSRNFLYAGNDDFYLYCCQPEQNQYPVWIFPTGFYVWSACAFSANQRTLYFCAADMTVYALNLANPAPPTERWAFPVPNICTSSPAVDSRNVVYFGAFDGNVYALNGSSGKQVWSRQTGGLIYASPAISNDGVLYIIAADAVLRALNTADGSVLWEFFTGMPSFSSAALGPDPEQPGKYLIYVGTGNGRVLALDPDGNRRWSFDIATLYQQNDDPSDPAFWSSFRYPAINSSLAIGSNGIATATSGGLILWIDYLYYGNSPRPNGINTSPVDDYIGQIDASGSFCYLSPTGRMASTVLQPTQSSLPLYAAEAISLVFLQKDTYAPGKNRAGFAAIPQNVQVSASDGAPITWRLSADGTQLYIDPVAAQASSRGITVSGGGQSLVKFNVNYRSVTAPLSQTDLLKQRFVIQQASFFSPFIVPALDQLGLATITIPFRIINVVNTASGALWAYGFESYNAGGAGAAVRNLLYTFTGTYQNGNLILASAPSYFELTSLPTPLTTMKVTGTVGSGDGSTPQLSGLSLLVEYTETSGSLVNWLSQLLDHWLDLSATDITSVSAIIKDPSLIEAEISRATQQVAAEHTQSSQVLLRVLQFLGRLAANFDSILAEWQLFNAESQFTWAGTYNLGTYAQPAPTLPSATSFQYNASASALTVTLSFAQAITNPALVVGIVILGADGLPLNLNYTNLNQPPTTSGNSLTQAINLTGVTLSGCKAVVFVELEMLPQTYAF